MHIDSKPADGHTSGAITGASQPTALFESAHWYKFFCSTSDDDYPKSILPTEIAVMVPVWPSSASFRGARILHLAPSGNVNVGKCWKLQNGGTCEKVEGGK